MFWASRAAESDGPSWTWKRDRPALRSRPRQPMPLQELADRLQELLQRPLVGDVHDLGPRLPLILQNRRNQVHTQHHTSFGPLGISISIQCHITRVRYNTADNIHMDRIGASAMAHCGRCTQSEGRYGRSRPSHLITGTCAYNGTHAQLILAASSCWIQEPGQGSARAGRRHDPGRCTSSPSRRTSPVHGLTGQCRTKLLSPLDRGLQRMASLLNRCTLPGSTPGDNGIQHILLVKLQECFEARHAGLRLLNDGDKLLPEANHDVVSVKVSSFSGAAAMLGTTVGRVCVCVCELLSYMRQGARTPSLCSKRSCSACAWAPLWAADGAFIFAHLSSHFVLLRVMGPAPDNGDRVGICIW